MKTISFFDDNNIRQITKLTPCELNQVKRTTQMKYKIMRVRAKISFIAFQRGQTIHEMLLNQIMKSYIEMARQKESELNDYQDHFDLFRMNDHFFQDLMTNNLQGVMARIGEMNSDEAKSKEMVFYLKHKYKRAANLVKNLPEPFRKMFMDKTTGKTLQKHIENDEDDFETHLKKPKQQTAAQFVSKTRSQNIFLLVADGQKSTLIDKTNYRDNIQYNQQKEKILDLYSKLKILVNLRALQGVMMLKALMSKVQVAKQMFILEIEQGSEAYIPNELCCENLPSSFWFYDACLQQVQNLVKGDKKEFAVFKNHYQLYFYQKNDVKKEILKKIGFINDESKQQQQLSLRFQAVNDVESNEIDHRVITTTMCLQRSRYVMIDNDVKRLQPHYEIQGHNQQKEMDKQIVVRGFTEHATLSTKFRSETRNLILRFCPDQEIFAKRQINLMMKSQFLTKIRLLKLMGKKQMLMQRADSYIEDNMETIFENYLIKNPRQKTAKKSIYEVVMADKLQNEEDDKIKKMLHSTLLDIIEKWLKAQLIQLRKASIKDIKQKNDKGLHFFTKNYLIDAGIEKHIKWYSKGRRLDVRNVLQKQMKQSRKKRLILGKDKKEQRAEDERIQKEPSDSKEEKIMRRIEQIKQQLRDNTPNQIDPQEQHQLMNQLLNELNLVKIRNLNLSIQSQQQDVMDMAADLEEKKLKMNKILVIKNQQKGTSDEGRVNDSFKIKSSRNLFCCN